MSAKQYVVVADSGDEKAVKRERPVFVLDGNEYFHGDEFVLPAGYALNMDGFEGRGLRFDYAEKYRNDEGKDVIVSHRIVLPLAAGAVENVKEPPAPVKVAPKKTPKGV